jgi:hypothetical protein
MILQQLHFGWTEFRFDFADNLKAGLRKDKFQEFETPVFGSEKNNVIAMSEAPCPLKRASSSRMKIGDERVSARPKDARDLRSESPRVRQMGDDERRKNQVGGSLGKGRGRAIPFE